MKRMLIIIPMTIVAGLIYHIVHECGHMLAAVISGEKIVKVQWLTYHGGSRVFYENEPQDYNKDTHKKWAVVAAAGYAATILLGYLMILLYFIVPNNYVKLFSYVGAMMSFVSDGGYFILGSLGNFGDIVGIRNILGIPKPIAVAISVLIFAVNMLVARAVFF